MMLRADLILNTGQDTQLTLYGYVILMRIVNNLLCQGAEMWSSASLPGIISTKAPKATIERILPW